MERVLLQPANSFLQPAKQVKQRSAPFTRPWGHHYLGKFPEKDCFEESTILFCIGVGARKLLYFSSFSSMRENNKLCRFLSSALSDSGFIFNYKMWSKFISLIGHKMSFKAPRVGAFEWSSEFSLVSFIGWNFYFFHP